MERKLNAWVLSGLLSQAVTQRLGCYIVDLEFKSMQADSRCFIISAVYALRKNLQEANEIFFVEKIVLFEGVEKE